MDKGSNKKEVANKAVAATGRNNKVEVISKTVVAGISRTGSKGQTKTVEGKINKNQIKTPITRAGIKNNEALKTNVGFCTWRFLFLLNTSVHVNNSK